MRIFYLNIYKWEYYTLIFANANIIFIFMFITLWHVTLIGEVFYHLIIYYINENIYFKSSVIKSLMEFWNLNPIRLIQLKSESNSNVSPCDVWQLLQTCNESVEQTQAQITVRTTRTVYFYFLCKIFKFWCAALSHMLSYSIMEYGFYKLMDFWSEKKNKRMFIINIRE